jgi:hypothetical protein
MNTFPVVYTVTYWDGVESRTSHGLLYAETPSDAVAQLEWYYGKNEIASVSFDMLESGLFEITEAERMEFIKRH